MLQLNKENISMCLPTLSSIDIATLLSNKRVQNQTRVGREGYGFIVMDIKASPNDVFSNLKSFQR